MAAKANMIPNHVGFPIYDRPCSFPPKLCCHVDDPSIMASSVSVKHWSCCGQREEGGPCLLGTSSRLMSNTAILRVYMYPWFCFCQIKSTRRCCDPREYVRCVSSPIHLHNQFVGAVDVTA
jgi:hypothetical protein